MGIISELVLFFDGCWVLLCCICDKVLAIYLFELLFSPLAGDWREGIEAGIYNRIDTILDIAITRIERTSYCCDFFPSRIN